jgi:putative nucleotidyltransferase with HDIG domain
MTKLLFPVPKGDHLLTGELHKRVIKYALQKEIEIYVVGGYLRDLVLNQFKPSYELRSKDLDYAVVGYSAFELAREIADNFEGHFVALDKSNDTARVVMPNGYILDFAGCLENNIDSDISRRDFTINALYIDIRDPENIVDSKAGIEDIRSGIVKAVDSFVFVKDPLRLLRAFRFAANLNFDIERNTFNWIQQHANHLASVAGERISSEIFLTFKASSSDAFLKRLAESGILESIFPELTAMRAVTNNAYHHLNLFDHSIEAVFQAEEHYSKRPDIWLKTNLTNYLAPSISQLSVCKVAALLHDIGKPSTWIITEDGKHTFISHERVGAQMIPTIAKRLRWSNAIENLISMLVELHLRPGQLFHNTPATAKGINRLYRRAGEHFPSLILLALGDLGATRGPQMTEEKFNFLSDKFYELLIGFEEYSLTTKDMKKILDGHEIMKLLNLEPGKELGEILIALQEAQELKEVSTYPEAVNFVRTYYQKTES